MLHGFRLTVSTPRMSCSPFLIFFSRAAWPSRMKASALCPRDSLLACQLGGSLWNQSCRGVCASLAYSAHSAKVKLLTLGRSLKMSPITTCKHSHRWLALHTCTSVCLSETKDKCWLWKGNLLLVSNSLRTACTQCLLKTHGRLLLTPPQACQHTHMHTSGAFVT